MHIRPILVSLVAIMSTNLVHAQDSKVTILSHQESVFSNDECKISKTCDLKKVEYFVEDYKVAIDGDYSYGRRFFARYETNSVKNLEKYAFVQFIKGCDFTMRRVGQKMETFHDIIYPRDNGAIEFNFKDWTIDSYDDDPVYSSIPKKSRLYGYRWNTVPNSFSTDTEMYYGQKKPKIPQLYIVDHPGSAFYVRDTAYNISLQFKTCIYRIKDIPDKVPHDKIDFAKPINCYEWNSSFIYNDATGKFDSPAQIVSACN